MVTHPTTNWPACGLSTAERTGSPVFHTLWSYVLDFSHLENIMVSCKACQLCKVAENDVNRRSDDQTSMTSFMLWKYNKQPLIPAFRTLRIKLGRRKQGNHLSSQGISYAQRRETRVCT